MERELRELTRVLRAEKNVFLRYLEELNRQQTALIENDLDSIRAGVEEIGRLAGEAADLEIVRKKVIDRLSEKLGLAYDDFTIGRLMEKSRGDAFAELEKLKDTILEIHRKARIGKDRNEKLIEQSMNVIRQTISSANDAGNLGANYGDPVFAGKNSASRAKSLAGTMRP